MSSEILLIRYLVEEVWRCVARSAGLVGGSNVGRGNRSLKDSPITLGDEENEEHEQHTRKD